MLYRLLLPCFETFTQFHVNAALHASDCDVVHGADNRWLLRTLGPESRDEAPTELLVRLHECSDLHRKSCDKQFHQPRGVVGWIEVRARGDRIERPARLRARLVALGLSEHLGLPVLETRNGVYCRTAEAFAAWCARERHPQTIPLAKREHTTAAPTPAPTLRMSIVCPPEAVAHAARKTAALPKQSWMRRAMRRLSNRRTYVITLPDACELRVIDALIHEVENTFRRRNVMYEDNPRRLVIYGKDTADGRRMIGYFRQRAQPQHLGLAPLHSGL